MYVRQLIGRQAGQIVEMPYHAASSNLTMGTVATVTDDELREAKLLPPEGVRAAAEPEIMPAGYLAVENAAGGFDVTLDGDKVNEAPLPNLPSARSFAEGHAKANPVTVDIPDGWEKLPWPQLRALASKIDAGAKTKDDCIAAVQAEVAKRVAGA